MLENSLYPKKKQLASFLNPPKPATSAVPGLPQIVAPGRAAATSAGRNPAIDIRSTLGSLAPGAPQAAGAQTFTPTAAAKSSYDYSYDPVLNAINASADADLSDAEATALQGKRGALQALGSRQVAESVLGPQDPVLGAISDNPDTSTSALARIGRGNRDAVKQNEDALNASNLFYGGYRGQVLKGLEQDRQTQVADATAAAQDALSQIASALTGAKRNARDKKNQASGDAYDRAASHPPTGGNGTDTTGGVQAIKPAPGGGGVGDLANYLPAAIAGGQQLQEANPELAAALNQHVTAGVPTEQPQGGACPPGWRWDGVSNACVPAGAGKGAVG